MPQIIFSHPRVEPQTLVIDTGANSIQWTYGLNTQTIPTYGGEVVQILSAFVDDISISGEIRTYAKMEKIYTWFLKYIQTATVGSDSDNPNFIDVPVTMQYPERGWELQIKPNSLPGYRKATEIVAPTWQLSAAVHEGDEAMNSMTLKEAAKRGYDFSALHGGIGYDEDNPFTDPAARKDKYDLEEYQGKMTDFYQSLIPSYLEGDFESLFNGGFFGSKPMQEWNDGQQKQDTKERGKKPEGWDSLINSTLGGL